MIPRPVAVLLAAVLIGSLTACGGSTGSASTPGAGTSATAKPGGSQNAQPAATAKPGSAPTVAAKGKTAGEPSNVAVPGGAAPYDGFRIVKLGETIELPASGLVVQVSNARTVEKDAQNDWVLADVVIGNKGKEKEPISSFVSFGVVSNEWKWYGITLDDAIELVSKDVAAGRETQLFDADVEPGKAVKGTAMAIVPKSAKELALSFQSTKIIALPNEPRDPMLFVSLGIRGEWPGLLVPSDGVPAKVGEVYKIGQAFKLPTSGIVMQVNRVWERTTPGKQAKLEEGSRFVFVDISMKKPAGVQSLEPRSEMSFVTSDGSVRVSPELFSMIYNDEGTRMLNQNTGRGAIVVAVPKSATSLALKVKPLGQSGDEALVDLGLGGAYVARVAASPTVRASATVKASPTVKAGTTPVPTVKPTVTVKASPTAAKPTATKAAGRTPTPVMPAFTDASKLAPEFSTVPIPAGFRIVADSVERYADGDQFISANATLIGTTSVADTVKFYDKAVAAHWTVVEGEIGDDEAIETFVNNDDPNLSLVISIARTGRGTEVELTVSKM